MDALGGVFFVRCCQVTTYGARTTSARYNPLYTNDLRQYIFTKVGVDILPITDIMGDVGGVTQLAECRIVYPVVAGSNPAVLASLSPSGRIVEHVVVSGFRSQPENAQVSG